MYLVHVLESVLVRPAELGHDDEPPAAARGSAPAPRRACPCQRAPAGSPPEHASRPARRNAPARGGRSHHRCGLGDCHGSWRWDSCSSSGPDISVGWPRPVRVRRNPSREKRQYSVGACSCAFMESGSWLFFFFFFLLSSREREDKGAAVSSTYERRGLIFVVRNADEILEGHGRTGQSFCFWCSRLKLPLKADTSRFSIVVFVFVPSGVSAVLSENLFFFH